MTKQHRRLRVFCRQEGVYQQSQSRMGTNIIQHSFSKTRVNAPNNWLNILWFLWILTCSTILLSKLVKVVISTWISVYILMNVRSLKIYIQLDLLQLRCVVVQHQSSGRFLWATRYLGLRECATVWNCTCIRLVKSGCMSAWFLAEHRIA